MTYSVIIPAHNEEAFIGLTLRSIVEQHILPTEVLVINDDSTDGTLDIVNDFVQKHSWISVISIDSESTHEPGSKVINAFLKGFEKLNKPYDIIVKLDADLILPANYFEQILFHFASDTQIGMAGGFAYIEKNNCWILENLTDKDHIRGAFKAYRKLCYEQIGGLKPAMGWDTIDELLAQYYGWKVITDSSLHVKHLKPTGANYGTNAAYKQGEAFYTLGYGLLLTIIASFKLAFLKKNIPLFLMYLKGYWQAQRTKKTLLVNAEQAQFIKAYRWKKIKEKVIFKK